MKKKKKNKSKTNWKLLTASINPSVWYNLLHTPKIKIKNLYLNYFQCTLKYRLAVLMDEPKRLNWNLLRKRLTYTLAKGRTPEPISSILLFFFVRDLHNCRVLRIKRLHKIVVQLCCVYIQNIPYAILLYCVLEDNRKTVVHESLSFSNKIYDAKGMVVQTDYWMNGHC